jgi:hypothetical protein
MATEFPAYGTNLLLSNPVTDSSTFCFSWNSLPGVHYFVQAKSALDTNAWTTISPTITASDFSTTYCVALPSPFHFFRVREGLVLVAQPPVISSLVASSKGVLLQWSATSGARFHVQWTDMLASPACWTSFPNVISSTNSSFSFSDDGSQARPLSAMRYYRLEQLP